MSEMRKNGGSPQTCDDLLLIIWCVKHLRRGLSVSYVNLMSMVSVWPSLPSGLFLGTKNNYPCLVLLVCILCNTIHWMNRRHIQQAIMNIFHGKLFIYIWHGHGCLILHFFLKHIFFCSTTKTVIYKPSFLSLVNSEKSDNIYISFIFHIRG